MALPWATRVRMALDNPSTFSLPTYAPSYEISKMRLDINIFDLMGDTQYGVEDGHGEVELSYMVDRFNRLHRSEELPSGFMNNDWHISTRELDIDGVKLENVRVVFACTPDASYALTSHFIKPATDKYSEIDTLIYHILALFAGYGSGMPLNPRALFAPHTWSFDGDIGPHICSRLRELGLEQKSLLVIPAPTDVQENRRKANYSWGRWRDTTVQEWSDMRRREPALSYESFYNGLSDQVRRQTYPGDLIYFSRSL